MKPWPETAEASRERGEAEGEEPRSKGESFRYFEYLRQEFTGPTRRRQVFFLVLLSHYFRCRDQACTEQMVLNFSDSDRTVLRRHYWPATSPISSLTTSGRC